MAYPIARSSRPTVCRLTGAISAGSVGRPSRSASVSEQVDLTDERVEIERRAVDRPVMAEDDAFRERSIEAEAHGEEVVVSKEARVVEEIALRRESDVRSETVSDTVRRTEVEIEDERGEVPLTKSDFRP